MRWPALRLPCQENTEEDSFNMVVPDALFARLRLLMPDTRHMSDFSEHYKWQPRCGENKNNEENPAFVSEQLGMAIRPVRGIDGHTEKYSPFI